MKDCSFSPKINQYSKVLVKNNSNYSKPIFLRNNENKKDFYKRKYELNFTHMPKINKNYKCNLDIYTRLYNKNKENNKNYINEDEYKFRPKTNYSFEKVAIPINRKNIVKRKKLLNEYITHQKVSLNNNNKENKISLTPNTSFTSISKISIKKEKKKIFMPYFNQITRMMNKPKKINNSLNNIKTNSYNSSNGQNYNLNNSYIQQYKNKKLVRNKSMTSNKSFLLDYMNKSFNKTNNQKQKKLAPINLTKSLNNPFYKSYNLIEEKIKRSNSKENVIMNFINKINLRNDENSLKGICVDINKKCNIIKKIVQKNKRMNHYK